jgi:hypothetical protein
VHSGVLPLARTAEHGGNGVVIAGEDVVEARVGGASRRRTRAGTQARRTAPFTKVIHFEV